MDRDTRSREGSQESLGEAMERDSRIRRHTQVRGSLGMPPSGREQERAMDQEAAIPEFDRMDDEDRKSER